MGREKIFKVGDIVESIDDNFRGRVTKIEKDEIFVMQQDGFTIPFLSSSLIKIEKEELSIDYSKLNLLKKIEPKRKPIKKQRNKYGNMTILEVDLHMEKLMDNPKKKMNVIPLDYQLRHAEGQLNFAISKGIQKIIFIHGVGDGILRAELETIVSRYPNVLFKDADYAKYGLGAMEIYIRQSKK